MNTKNGTYEALASRGKMSPAFDLMADTLDASSLIGGKIADYRRGDLQRGNGACKWLSARLEDDGTTSLIIISDEFVSNNTDLEKITVVIKKSFGEIFWLEIESNQKPKEPVLDSNGKGYRQRGLVKKMTAIQRADYLAQLAKKAQTAKVGKPVDDQEGFDYLVNLGTHLERFENGGQSWKRRKVTQ